MRGAVDRLFRQETDTYNARIKAENEKSQRARYAERPYPVVAALRKIDCVPASDSKPKPGFVCYFEMTLDGTPLKRPGRFYLDEGSWVYARL
ncbi:hypothetical protein GCM10007301_25540 [Azorhizobium oxalatiphilum]|uniref:Uncharacterized protein n=1 Tax=Azorhizobium oxalatiphilum TaxID=980631 RepID=A0A917FCE2_9HYPH|nr:hypothetical protein [Azorhizobium oxalatiphilum]GGF64637.1 hypothetical protein GCM10007301_25540 [Azorhizobium oxalatiphilum]